MGMALVVVGGIGSLVCWIMVLIKMFSNKEKGGVLQGVIGIICSLWAFIWGWMNSGLVGKNIMLAWTVCIVLSMIGNFLAAGEMMPAQ